MKLLTSSEILDKVSDSSIAKANSSVLKIFMLAVLAGAFIAFGAEGSTLASFNLTSNPATVGLGKFVAGMVFPVGLMLVVLCGAELFTGNCMMFAGVADKKIKLSGVFKNWAIVYIGNFVGAMIIVLFIHWSGQLDTGDGLLGAMTVKAAIGKCNLSFGRAFVLGIMCNWLVCLAVWMATGADNAAGKILAMWFVIMVFVLSGFEHSVANMYFIPAGLLAAQNDAYVNLLSLDTTGLTIYGFVVKNLIPVTLGNIVGGGGFVAMFYWIIHRKA